MLQHWLGDITEVYAMEGGKERPFEVDSTVQIIMKFASGAVGSFLLSEFVLSLRSLVLSETYHIAPTLAQLSHQTPGKAQLGKTPISLLPESHPLPSLGTKGQSMYPRCR